MGGALQTDIPVLGGECLPSSFSQNKIGRKEGGGEDRSSNRP